MYIKRFKEVLPYLFKAKVTAFVWGAHGVGKSMSVRQFCEENGFGFVDIRLGTQEVGDLLGLAKFEKSKETGKEVTSFAMPDWINNVFAFCEKNPDKKYVIFLDELNRARRDVLQAVFQLVLDHQFHTVKLPANCHVVAASNYNSEDYITADIGDKAFMDRFCHFKLTPSTKEWLEYGEGRKFDKNLLNFITQQPDLLDAKVAEADIEVTPSRRSWEAVDRLIKAETPMDILQEICFGLVGKPATIAFMESIKNADKPIPATEILSNYPKYAERVKEWGSMGSNRNDLLKITNDDLKKHFEANDKALKAKEAKNLTSYLKDLPLDLSFSLVGAIYINEHIVEVIDADEELVNMIITKKK